MKKLIVSALLITCLAFAGYSQEKKEGEKPKATYLLGAAKISVWENKQQGKQGEFTTTTYKVEKIYKKDDKWNSTDYFDLEDLLKLRAIIDQAVNEEIKKK